MTSEDTMKIRMRCKCNLEVKCYLWADAEDGLCFICRENGHTANPLYNVKPMDECVVEVREDSNV